MSNASHVPGARSDCLTGNGASRLLIAAILLVLFLLFFRYYAKSPPVLSVVQVRASAFHPDMLMEKQPILIEDRVCDVEQLMRTTLKYYYTYARVRRNLELFHERKSSFILTYAAATFVSPEFYTKNGKKKPISRKKLLLRAFSLHRSDFPAVDFLLHPGQVLVLPPHWKVTAPAPTTSHSAADKAKAKINLIVAEAYDMLHVCMLPIGCSGALVRRSTA